MHKDIKQKALRRLAIVSGQVQGIKKMVEEDKYCIDIITQSAAVKEALSGVEDLILENHLTTHAAHQMMSGKGKQATEEILKVYKLKRK
ncbi:MAG: hypothetical protein A2855_01270 [Candidatus Liptonbacteria bacterium RIFCSPHIGHO2_01_FULL_57_28]|uniref:Transcriptional regulator n=1 Tax=Candidatus Liptonbacteria bacterium RIFCSPHIGHO2_01_FULL_57_28 TaxID=1798647 RepID=A0A1G2CB73_9BACT|nr:MAG: hypothetical protein A2855_01270 [Candidatus Liptonbacteria bacterium RIFCSPHIGHO2_01_FULL_57_28]